MLTGNFIGEWKSGLHSISLYHAADQFSARIQDQAGSQTKIDSKHIKCGIFGTTPHDLLIQKIDRLGKEHFSVCCYPFQGQPTEVWVFEALQGAAPWIKKAKENLAQMRSEKEEAIDCYQKALKNFDTAFRIQEKQKGDTAELNSAILQLKKELFLLQIKRDLPLYLSSAQEQEVNEVIELYKEEDLFSGLSEYLKAFEESAALSPYYLFLSALLDEHSNRPTSAIQHYLRLAEHHPDPLPCFKKVEELVKQTIVSDPFALPHFLEKLDGTRLIKLRQTTHYPEDLERLLLQKDAVRMTFEKSLATLNQHSSQTKTPTCFICFNVEEADVATWLEQVLVPDLDRMGIQPLFCFRDLDPGKGEQSNFQKLIRKADQVMVACTPDLKRKCEECEKNPTGVAQEIRLAQQRYKDIDKYETIFLLYLKGDQKESCPSEFFEPIQGSKLNENQESSVLSYYANAFEFFGGMRNIPRETSRRIKENFLVQANKILAGKIKQEELEKWRQGKQSQIEQVLKEAQERVTKMTQMVHLPFPPKDFTGRQQELQDLHAACQQHHRVAITGLGGVGKTALAIKYANDHQADYQFIYHIQAGTSQQIRDELLRLADDLHIPKVDKIEERLHFLKRKLDQFEQKYLLIFDGIDQVEAFDELTKYIPNRGNCLLLTSRMPGQSRRNFEVIELKPFSLEDAINYLLQATGSEDKEKASELAERLGRLPLALTHAAGYIRNCNISIDKYIQVFNRSQLELFEKRQLDFLPEGEKTILTTWNISLSAIETVHKCPLAKEVMAFFAFLGQASIPFDLVKEWLKTVHSANEELELLKALRHLCGYSMIDRPSLDFYQVHPLVQQVTHHQMTNPQQHFEPAFMTLNLQIEKFQKDNVNTWHLTKLMVPHALSLLKRRDLIAKIAMENQCEFMNRLGRICMTYGNFYQALEVEQDSLKVAKQWHEQHPQLQKTNIALATSYNNIGESLESQGKHDEALENMHKALVILRRVYGEDHSDVAKSHNNIGESLRSQGKYNEALNYQRKALEILQKVYDGDNLAVGKVYNSIGLILRCLEKHEDALKYYQKALKILRRVTDEDHPDIAASYHNIVLSLESLGKYDKTLEYSQKALEILLKVYGEDHPHVALTYNNIGASLYSQGKYDEALKYQRKALEIFRKVYEEDHPHVAKNYISIGSSLDSQGKYDEALKYQQKALEILRKVYSENHPDVAAGYHNIGLSLNNLGRYYEALEYNQKALKIRLKVHGENHPDVAKSHSNIGESLRSQGKYDEALEYQRKALEIFRKVYEEDHPAVATSYNNIGESLRNQGKYDDALEYQRKALEIWRKVYKEDHPAVATSYNNIGESLRSQGKYDDALEYQQKALEIKRKVYGEDHPDVATSYNNIGACLYSQRKYDDALEYQRKALEISRKVYGENHPDVASGYINIGASLFSQGKYDDALEYQRKALEIWRKVHGEDHSAVATSYHNIGESLSGLGKYDDALEYKRKALRIRQKVYGEDHFAVATSYDNIGESLSGLGKYDDALEYKRKALGIWRKVYGEDHHNVAASYNNIGACLYSQGKYDEALEYFQKALEIFEKFCPPNHPELLRVRLNLNIALNNANKSQQQIKNQSGL